MLLRAFPPSTAKPPLLWPRHATCCCHCESSLLPCRTALPATHLRPEPQVLGDGSLASLQPAPPACSVARAMWLAFWMLPQESGTAWRGSRSAVLTCLRCELEQLSRTCCANTVGVYHWRFWGCPLAPWPACTHARLLREAGNLRSGEIAKSQGQVRECVRVLASRIDSVGVWAVGVGVGQAGGYAACPRQVCSLAEREGEGIFFPIGLQFLQSSPDSSAPTLSPCRLRDCGLGGHLWGSTAQGYIDGSVGGQTAAQAVAAIKRAKAAADACKARRTRIVQLLREEGLQAYLPPQYMAADGWANWAGWAGRSGASGLLAFSIVGRATPAPNCFRAMSHLWWNVSAIIDCHACPRSARRRCCRSALPCPWALLV